MNFRPSLKMFLLFAFVVICGQLDFSVADDPKYKLPIGTYYALRASSTTERKCSELIVTASTTIGRINVNFTYEEADGFKFQAAELTYDETTSVYSTTDAPPKNVFTVKKIGPNGDLYIQFFNTERFAKNVCMSKNHDEDEDNDTGFINDNCPSGDYTPVVQSHEVCKHHTHPPDHDGK